LDLQPTIQSKYYLHNFNTIKSHFVALMSSSSPAAAAAASPASPATAASPSTPSVAATTISVPPPIQKLLDAAEIKKKEADLVFTRSNFTEAIQLYSSVIMLLAPLRATPFGELIALRCFSNQIQCHLKLSEWEKAIQVCRFALTVPCSAHEVHLAQKIHTRCALALESLGQFEPALYAIDRAISYDATSADLDHIRLRLIESLNSDKAKIFAVPPRPVNFASEEVSRIIVEILKTRGQPEAILPALKALVARSVYIDRRDEKGFNIMWAVCRAAIHRSAIPNEHPDDVYPLVEILVMHGSRAEQRYSSIDKDHNQSHQQHQTPLMLFAIAGAVDCAKLLLKTGASVMTCDGEGWTPLLVACAPSSPRINHENKGAIAPNDEMVEMLLEHKAQVNAQNAQGLSALHCAAQAGDIHSAALLIHANAKLNLRSANGFTPIIWALIGAKGNRKADMVQMLLDACLTPLESDSPTAKAEDEEKGESSESSPPAASEETEVSEERKALHEECVEDMKCFLLSHLILQLKFVLQDFLMNYEKAQKAIGNEDANLNKPAAHLVQRRVADALGRITGVVTDLGGKEELVPKYLTTVSNHLVLYSTFLTKLKKDFLPEQLFKQWRPVDNPQLAVQSADPIDQARLTIIMTSTTGPNTKEPPLSRNVTDDFMLCGRYPDYRMLVRETLVSVMSTSVPSSFAIDRILQEKKIVLLMNTGADYWLDCLRERMNEGKDQQEDATSTAITLVRTNDEGYAPLYFETQETIGIMDSVANLSDSTLVVLWPISNMMSTTSKELVEKEESLVVSFTGEKIIVIGDVSYSPPGAPLLAQQHLKANYECIDTVSLDNWETYDHSLTVWTKL
jgi:ankyrin repeat protein